MWDKVLVLTVSAAVGFLLCKLLQGGHNKYKFYTKFFIYFLYSSAWASLVWPFFLFRPRSVHNARFGAWLLSPITNLFEVEWILRKKEFLCIDGGAVIVSNHQSSLDILGLFNIWHVVYKMTVIAKRELLYVFPFGLSAYLAGVVFINRTNAKNAYNTLKVASDVMVKDKTKIWMFPEGTRNKDYTRMLSFKKGAFAMAVAAQVPIIPVVFSPYYFINRKKYIFDIGQVVIQCLEPVSTKGLTSDDVPNLMNKVREKMTIAYEELTKEVLESLPANYPFTTDG